MNATAIIEVLSRRLPADVSSGLEAAEARDGMPTFYTSAAGLPEVCLALRDAPELRFAFCADVTAVDYHPREPRYELLYVLACPGVAGFGETPKRLRLKVRVKQGESVPSVSSVWAAANWGEREVFDFFGIEFSGHPDLRRILMPDDWEGFPMRKDYPVQINQPVKTYSPLQVSEEDFVANVQAARDGVRGREPGR